MKRITRYVHAIADYKREALGEMSDFQEAEEGVCQKRQIESQDIGGKGKEEQKEKEERRPAEATSLLAWITIIIVMTL